jgi:hypothetical protein
MTYEEFKDALLYEIENATDMLDDEKNVLDLRAGRYPYNVIKDVDIFSLHDIHDAWEFVKDAEEWYVDVYENYAGENYAEFTGFAVVSWNNN